MGNPLEHAQALELLMGLELMTAEEARTEVAGYYGLAKTPTTVRTCRILQLQLDPPAPFGAGPGAQLFVQLDEDTGLPSTSLTIGPQSWEDLGRPQRVTVTVEPGDLLNP